MSCPQRSTALFSKRPFFQAYHSNVSSPEAPTPSEGPGQPPAEGPDATALTNAQVHTGFFVGFMKRFRIMMGFLDARRRYMWEQSIPSFLLLLFGISQFGMEDFLNLLFPSAVP
ncbi:hypothetical protein I204_03482 [Kwoniella mangroviensis CBS 8886]|nr:uncharacterized protein I203_00541 [Kwoniella mangroviensis CBS 8507]OCF70407.1 hypothetical protein I203_00541 [Kwoniella mangroviensis CBS 8507]OCF76183.1 hypothetical protein I204_03482 [Kwoniella mangroviensis CBS 8886]